MFSEFPLFSSLKSMPLDIRTESRLQADSVNHLITENRRVQIPANSGHDQDTDLLPGPSSSLRSGQTRRGSPPTFCANYNSSGWRQNLKVVKCKSTRTQPPSADLPTRAKRPFR